MLPRSMSALEARTGNLTGGGLGRDVSGLPPMPIKGVDILGFAYIFVIMKTQFASGRPLEFTAVNWDVVFKVAH
jgi:hypothetical protein